MINFNPKYNYKPLNRIDGASRLYETPDGARVPSVTTILDRTKSEESKQALQNWRKRVGEQLKQPAAVPACTSGLKTMCSQEKLEILAPILMEYKAIKWRILLLSKV